MDPPLSTPVIEIEEPLRAAPRVIPSLRSNFAWTFVGNVLYAGCQWGMLLADVSPDAPRGRSAEGRGALRPGRAFGARRLHAPRRARPTGPRFRPHGRPHRNPAGRRAAAPAGYLARAARSEESRVEEE